MAGILSEFDIINSVVVEIQFSLAVALGRTWISMARSVLDLFEPGSAFRCEGDEAGPQTVRREILPNFRSCLLHKALKQLITDPICCRVISPVEADK
jgi:hypothetical protein